MVSYADYSCHPSRICVTQQDLDINPQHSSMIPDIQMTLPFTNRIKKTVGHDIVN